MKLRQFCLISIIIFLICSCRKDEKLTTSPAARLSFSSDTISFDTVFASIGSITRQLKVFNYNKNSVKISEIKLVGGNSSPYQLNINGIAASSLSDIQIRGNDSLNLFVKITVNPTSNVAPFKIEDAISFLTNGNMQAIPLRAWGQNVHLLKDAVVSQNTTWDNQLPYIIYNTIRVSSGSTLTIPARSKIYFHKDSRMIVDGSLQVEGTVANAVVFSSDRLEHIYQDEPGQWAGLYFTGVSKGNKINNALIKNAIVGIQADSLSGNAEPKLLLTNSTLKNMQIAGLSCLKTNVAAFNNLFYNCGQYLIYVLYGGDYNLKQNTFANFSNTFPRQTPSLFFSDANTETLRTAQLMANLTNNIITGSLADELVFEKKGTAMNIVLQNNLIKTKNTGMGGNGNILNADPLFISLREDNYQLSSGSPAANKGLSLNSDFYYNSYLKADKSGKPRLFPSEIGCYEN